MLYIEGTILTGYVTAAVAVLANILAAMAEALVLSEGNERFSTISFTLIRLFCDRICQTETTSDFE